MNKNEIIRILEDWNFWKRDMETGVPRNFYLDQLKEFLSARQVMVVIGPRRSGKSFVMRQFAKWLIAEKGIDRKNILFINFEDPRLPEMNARELDQIFNYYLESLAPQGELFVFLDEIQEVAGWERWVRTMHELNKATLIISGSNADLLSQELATSLTGRHLNITVFPLSFKEYLSFHDILLKDKLDMVHNETTIKGLFRRYLEEGAYPAAVLAPRETREILLSYFEDILNKDLIRRYKIRKAEKLKALARFYLTQVASLCTHNSIARFLEITPNTVEKFSGYLETSYLVFFLKRFSFKLKEQEKSPRKVFSVDTGLANTVGFKFSENLGRSAENLVFLELLRKKAANPLLEIYFWKDIHHREVDFVVKEALDIKELIQVSWNISKAPTRDRELRSLLKAMEDLKLSEALVITEEEEAEETIKGKKIGFIPIWKWLLDIKVR